MAAVQINSRSAILSFILLGTVGVLSFIVQPGLVQAFVTELGLSESEANGLAFAEMLGVALATVVMIFASRVISWRILLTAGLVIAAMGNLGSAFGSAGNLGAIRFVAGLGEGIIITLGFMFLGLTRNTERNLALNLVLLLTYGALGLWAMPTVLAGIGLKGVFLIWALINIVALATVKFVPRSMEIIEEPSPQAVQVKWVFIGVALLACFLYNTAIGVAWANLFLIGMDIKPDEQAIANALLIAQFVAIPGALLAFVIARKIPRNILVGGGILLAAVAITPLLGGPDYMKFVIAVSAFNFMWNLALPFILSAVSDMDEKGRAMPAVIACQMLGLGFGPAIAASLLGNNQGFDSIKMITIYLLIASFVVFLFPLWKYGQALKARNG